MLTHRRKLCRNKGKRVLYPNGIRNFLDYTALTTEDSYLEEVCRQYEKLYEEEWDTTINEDDQEDGPSYDEWELYKGEDNYA